MFPSTRQQLTRIRILATLWMEWSWFVVCAQSSSPTQPHPSSAAGLCASVARVSVNRDEVVVRPCSRKPAICALSLIGFRDLQGLPATVRPTRLMILMQASINFEVSTGFGRWPFIFPEIPFYWRCNCSPTRCTQRYSSSGCQETGNS